MLPDELFEYQLAGALEELALDPSSNLRKRYVDVLQACPDRAYEFLIEVVGAQVVTLTRQGRPVWMEEIASQYPELKPTEILQLLADKHATERVRLERALAFVMSPANGAPSLPRFEVEWKKAHHGRTGQGQVWVSKNRDLGRLEAVKILHGATLSGGIEKAAAEARKLASIHHAAVCEVYGFEIDLSNRPCLRMEFIEGAPLDEWASRKSPESVAALLADVALGVQAIHDANLVHVDLKPANILVTKEGKPKVVDFGLAREPGTLGGRVIGTRGYMGPEQAEGRRVDGRSDVYALGRVLDELTGTSAPADIQAICRMATHADPKHRYATAEQVAEELSRYVCGAEVQARPWGRLKKVMNWTRDHRLGVIGVLLSTLLITTTVVSVISARQRKREDIQRADADTRRTERDDLVVRLEGDWRNATVRGSLRETVEADLDRLNSLDPAAAIDQRVKYVDTLLGRVGTRPETRSADLVRLTRAVEPFTRQGGVDLDRLESPVRAAFFRQRVAPEDLFDKLDLYLRPDPTRIPDLLRAAELEAVFGQPTGRPGVKVTLVRALMAAGDLDRAWSEATVLLDRAGLLPAWQLVVFRDLVWIALSEPNQIRLDDASRRVESALRAGPEFAELAVEKARLCVFAGKRDEAARILDAYLRSAQAGELDLRPESSRTQNKRFTDGPTKVNVPVLFYLDAATLRGFLPGAPPGVWKTAFDLVRRYRTGAYYEAAILGSLAGDLGPSDAVGMVISTAEDPLSESSLFQRLREVPTDRKTLDMVTEVLRRSWDCKRGREMAQGIAERAIPFSEFVHAQFRLWVYCGLGVVTRDPGVALLPEEDEVFWKVAEGFRTALADGLPERVVTDLLTFAAGDLSGKNSGKEQLPRGVTHPNEWDRIAATLPHNLQGPVAYTLGQVYIQQAAAQGGEVGRRAARRFIAPVYLAYARKHADGSICRDALLKALDAEATRK